MLEPMRSADLGAIDGEAPGGPVAVPSRACPEHRGVEVENRENWRILRGSVDLALRRLRASAVRPNEEMRQLLILGEDHRFAWHPGVDPLALCRAAWRTYGRGRREGGSTVAMQLVRVLTGRFDRSWRRKIDEMALAIRLTRHVSKADLPELYLFVAYYGWRMNGFGQACRRLDLDPVRCSLQESAMLVARLKYPQPRRCARKRWEQITLRSEYLMARYESDASA